MVVDTSIKYNSVLLKSDINNLIIRYPFIEIITIGYSVSGVPIYCIKVRFWSKRSALLWCNSCKRVDNLYFTYEISGESLYLL